MVESISNQLKHLKHKKWMIFQHSWIQLQRGCSFIHHQEDHFQDLMCLQERGTLAEFNDAFDAISCKLKSPTPKTVFLKPSVQKS